MIHTTTVSSVAKNGSTGITGNVTLSEGTNITLTQTGNNIEVNSTGGVGAFDYGMAYVMAANLTMSGYIQ